MLDTVTVADPGKAVSVAVMAAVSCVAFTKVVWRGRAVPVHDQPIGHKICAVDRQGDAGQRYRPESNWRMLWRPKAT